MSMNIEQPIKDYMLFVFGSFVEAEDSELLVQLIGEQFLDVTYDSYLPYTFGPYFVVYKFKSDKSFQDINGRVDDTIREMCHSYYLLEMTDNMSYKADDDVVGSFFPDKSTENKVKTTPKQPESIFDLMNSFMESFKNDEQYINFEILGTEFGDKPKKKKEKVLSLDEVLEKIVEHGIDSLTKKEKQTLDNYANGK